MLAQSITVCSSCRRDSGVDSDHRIKIQWTETICNNVDDDAPENEIVICNASLCNWSTDAQAASHQVSITKQAWGGRERHSCHREPAYSGAVGCRRWRRRIAWNPSIIKRLLFQFDRATATLIDWCAPRHLADVSFNSKTMSLSCMEIMAPLTDCTRLLVTQNCA